MLEIILLMNNEKIYRKIEKENMINTLIFSKDRAMQLELLLRSIKENFKELSDITILYKFSTNDFAEGYNKVIKLYPKYKWVLEENFEQQTKQIINGFKKYYTLILVDDEVVVNDFSINDTLVSIDTNKLHCISLRMHPNVNYSYAGKVESNPPTNIESVILSKNRRALIWNWKEYLIKSGKEYADWSYPSAINSHIYKTILLKNIVKSLRFNKVNSLEGNMHITYRNSFREKILIFEKPKTICISNNKAQSENNNISGNKDVYSLELMNWRFIKEFRICSENLYGLKYNQINAEIDYLFERT